MIQRPSRQNVHHGQEITTGPTSPPAAPSAGQTAGSGSRGTSRGSGGSGTSGTSGNSGGGSGGSHPELELLTQDDASRLLKISRRQVQIEIAEGRLPAVRIGRRCLLRPIDLSNFISARLRRERSQGQAPGREGQA
ncbi:MAG: helix-turn-helix domain-containing protein [Phycisphaeraceae bacterium]|nr:helix-turn-helix domain-containing protein [Phycisphaeraceae bacterium]